MFRSESDCEVLLPPYREQGLSMFRQLDAEFALILYDAKQDKLIAARDPLGIRPLFYGKDKSGGMLFASEAKTWLGCVTRSFRFHRAITMTESILSVTGISRQPNRTVRMM